MKPAQPPPEPCGKCGRKPAVHVLTSKDMLPVCMDCWEKFLLGKWDDQPVPQEGKP